MIKNTFRGRLRSFIPSRGVGHAQPGDIVTTHWDKTTFGLVIAVNDDLVTVMWTLPPHKNEEMMTALSEQIAKEINRDILNDLLAGTK